MHLASGYSKETTLFFLANMLKYIQNTKRLHRLGKSSFVFHRNC